MKERLQKLSAAAGLCSRREAEEWIRRGDVTVNGRTASLGESADPEEDLIRVRGKELSSPEEKRYILLYKPRGYVTTASDEKGRKAVTELVASLGLRLFPVGRLDLDSEGLLLMTNDGAMAQKLAHPSHRVEKRYRVTVRGKDLDAGLKRLGEEFVLDGKKVRAVSLSVRSREEGRAVVELGITQGLNRQIRRMCEASSLEVRRLCRVSEGELRLGHLRPGEWRFLTEKELRYLRSLS